MKIYKLDIDVAQPIRQVVQMQQNTTGALLVRASKDEHTLRNATIKLYDGETEIEPYYTEGDYAMFKIDMGQETKNLKLKVEATPYTSTAKYLVNSGTGPVAHTYCELVQIPAGTYQQDEFMSLVRFGSFQGISTILYSPADQANNANANRINLMPWNQLQPIWFGYQETAQSPVTYLDQNEPIVVTEDIVFGHTVTHKRTKAEFATFDYPSVGYYADYNQEIVVSPNSFAHFYAEQDLPDDEEPIDSSDSELDSTDTGLDSTDTGLDSTDTELTEGE